MDLRSGYPYWTVRGGLLGAFPPMREDLECDVAIVGAGITGALIGWRLQQDGYRVVVLDRREACWGSTSASTAMLQYELDTELHALARMRDTDDAVLAYRACVDALNAVGRIARRFRDCGYAETESLYFAGHRFHRGRIDREYAMRREHGLDVERLEEDALRERYGLDAPCALLTRPAARVDPYRFAHALLRAIRRRGGQVFDRTPMARFDVRPRGVTVESEDGPRVRARHLVIAGGYESQRYIDERVAANRSSYAFVTEPLPAARRLADVLVWETARPYLYLRHTDDGRLLVGGADDRVDIPARRDAVVATRARSLVDRVQRFFPGLEPKPAWSWGGTFAETRDGLPFLDSHEQHGPRVLFAMAYGGNGIVYAQLAAEIFSARLRRHAHPCDRITSFARLRRG